MTDRELKKTSDDHADLYNPVRLNILGNTLVVLLTVGGIAVPVLLLFLQPMNRAAMSIVAIGFVLLFTVSVAGMTGARVQDIMFGTAAQDHLLTDVGFDANINQVFGSCHHVPSKCVSGLLRKMRMPNAGVG